MSRHGFDVILIDPIAGNADRRKILNALARKFDQDVHRVADRLKKGDPVIKRGVDEPTGRQYLQALSEAGTRGRLRPAAPSDRLAPADSRRPGSATTPALPVRVISPRPQPADVSFAPIQANRISQAEAGIDVNRIDTPPITFGAIDLIAVYEDREAEKIYLLVFRKKQKRPFVCDANRVVYSEFPGTQATSVVASLRRFCGFIARQHTTLRVDPPTAAFLEGRPPAALEIDPVRYMTTLGKSLIRMAADPVG